MASERTVAGWSVEKKREVLDALLQDPDILIDEPESIGIIPILDTMEQAAERQADGGWGLLTGYSSLDQMTHGLGEGELIIVFGDTGHGKSQLCQNITYRVAERGEPVLFIGLEMDNAENTVRFQDIAGKDSEAVAALPILDPATNDIKLENIEQIVADGVKLGAKLVVIDHLHWLSRSIDNQTSELSMITQAIKRIAVANAVPILLVSHINRTGSLDKPPSLQHLKGSSSIGQDADKAIAVWRDPEDPTTNELLVVIRKNRRAPKLPIVSLTIQGVQIIEPVLTAIFPGALPV